MRKPVKGGYTALVRRVSKNGVGKRRKTALDKLRRTTNSHGDSDFQPKIVVHRYGRIKDHKVNRMVGVMRECYDRLPSSHVSLVDLYIFERSSTVEAFLAEESRRVGVASSSFSELFFSMHDAWTGIPRIMVCLEKMKELPILAQEGGMHHEVGHSVLHGSLNYYMFTIPPALLVLSRCFNLSRQYVTNMSYLMAIAVKDYEVSRLLHSHGYLKDQLAFAKHMLTPSEGDRASWKMASVRSDAKALCLASYLKLIGYATPFLADEDSEKEIYSYIKECLSFLPEKHSRELVEETPKFFQQLELDTMNNIDRFTQLAIEKVIRPIFEDEADDKVLA